ncbi:uncharacterized protein LOC144616409 isoform X2 [Panthera onca]
MDGLVGACGRGPPVFGAVLVARRDWPELRCSRSPRRPPFHILRRRRGQPRRRLFTRPNGELEQFPQRKTKVKEREGKEDFIKFLLGM